MCLGGTPSPPPPPPLAPPPPPPAPPRAPIPEPEPLISEDVNPAIRQAKSKKAGQTGMSKGTGALRIGLRDSVNTGATGESTTGVNKGTP